MNIPIRRGPLLPPPVPEWSPHDKVSAHFNAQNQIDIIVFDMVFAADMVRIGQFGILPFGGL